MRHLKPIIQRLNQFSYQPQVVPFLVCLTGVMLLLLPASLLPLDDVNLRAIPIAMAFGLCVSIICLAIFEIVRLQRLRLSLLSGWFTIFCGFIMIATFYDHADALQANWQRGILLLILFTFIALQQFRFNYQQRQYLLLILIALSWILIPYSFFPKETLVIQNANTGVNMLDPHTTSIVLLTSLALSAYLIARTKTYRKTWTLKHIPLLLSPLVLIPAIMAWQQPWLITVTLASVLLSQAFLFKYCAHSLHMAWNIMVMAGFFMAYLTGDLPTNALFSARFTSDEWELMQQTAALMGETRFQGVGFGQLEQSQIIYGQIHNNPLTINSLYPSWLLAWVVEGGVAVWFPMTILCGLMLKRLMIAPRATRLMLFAILMPSILGMLMTSYAATQPLLLLLFVIVLYWLDNISAEYRIFNVRHTKGFKVFAVSLLCGVNVLTFSSVYFSIQADNATLMNNNQLTQFHLHPWWQGFYKKHYDYRQFMQDVLEENQAGQNDYLYEQMKEIAKKPSAEKYQKLLDLALQTNNLYIAEQIKQEAKTLFPFHQFTLEPIILKKQESDE